MRAIARRGEQAWASQSRPERSSSMGEVSRRRTQLKVGYWLKSGCQFPKDLNPRLNPTKGIYQNLTSQNLTSKEGRFTPLIDQPFHRRAGVNHPRSEEHTSELQ